MNKERITQYVNVETQNVGKKPRQPTSCRIHYERETQQWKHRGNDLFRFYALGRNRAVDLCTEKTENAQRKRGYTDINVENPNVGKNHGSPQAAEYTMREKYNNGSTEATTS